MPFSEAEKNVMLDAFPVHDVGYPNEQALFMCLHHGDPGKSGQNNEISSQTDYAWLDGRIEAADLDAAASAQRVVNKDIAYNISGGLGDDSTIAWVVIEDSANFPIVKTKLATQIYFEVDGQLIFQAGQGITLSLID